LADSFLSFSRRSRLLRNGETLPRAMPVGVATGLPAKYSRFTRRRRRSKFDRVAPRPSFSMPIVACDRRSLAGSRLLRFVASDHGTVLRSHVSRDP
jgi:hypothetical protein